MSEASRQRWLFLRNRLEEIDSRHGPPEIPESGGVACDPSWGPVGSLLQQADPALYAKLVATDEATNRMERAARIARGEPPEAVLEQPAPGEPSNAPLAPTRVLSMREALQKLDRYGETELFACPICGEESAKASIPINLWHCTACNANGTPPRPAPRAPEVWERQ